MTARIIHGDCIEAMQVMSADSIDSIVTDPPYGLGFMGKKWDALPPGKEWAKECLRVLKPGGHILAFGGSRTWHRLAVAIEDGGFEIRDSIAWLYGQGFPKNKAQLKPAFEPIVMGRKKPKPHGGLLRIDACRIDSGADYHDLKVTQGGQKINGGKFLNADAGPRRTIFQPATGRFPANVILDESQAALLDKQSGRLRAGGRSGKRNSPKPQGVYDGGWKNAIGEVESDRSFGDSGGASRFFYCAKAPKNERPDVGGTPHPTVKPLTLMRYLIRLVTPEGGTVLDTFAGSGTTLEAAQLEGFDAIGIEAEADYLPLIEQRLERAS